MYIECNKNYVKVYLHYINLITCEYFTPCLHLPIIELIKLIYSYHLL